MVRTAILMGLCALLSISFLSDRLMHNYQPGQASSSANAVDSPAAQVSSVTQSDLYASYLARFGSDISAQADTSDSAGNALVPPSSAAGDLDIEPVYTRSGSAPGNEIQDVRTPDVRDEPDPDAGQKKCEQPGTDISHRRRLITHCRLMAPQYQLRSSLRHIELRLVPSDC
jgi:hypothetical protein